ncbi:MAG: bacteriohemerythrin [Alphaproteobacteria bacterium]
MPYTEWTEELSVGVPIMDEEHKKWLGILNEIHDALKTNANAEVMQTIIGRMLEYTIMHLTHEEMYMLHIKYPLFESHREKHNALIRKIELLDSRLKEKSNFRLTIDTVFLLKNWLTNHIMVVDKKYKEYIEALNNVEAE